MENVDYSQRFNAAMAKAFAASDCQVQLAYFDLGNFYHGKLCDRRGMHPTAEIAPEGREQIMSYTIVLVQMSRVGA